MVVYAEALHQRLVSHLQVRQAQGPASSRRAGQSPCPSQAPPWCWVGDQCGYGAMHTSRQRF